MVCKGELKQGTRGYNRQPRHVFGKPAQLCKQRRNALDLVQEQERLLWHDLAPEVNLRQVQCLPRVITSEQRLKLRRAFQVQFDEVATSDFRQPPNRPSFTHLARTEQNEGFAFPTKPLAEPDFYAALRLVTITSRSAPRNINALFIDSVRRDHGVF